MGFSARGLALGRTVVDHPTGVWRARPGEQAPSRALLAKCRIGYLYELLHSVC